MKRYKKACNVLLSLLSVGFFAGCIMFREPVRAGFSADLTLCVQTLLPSLFPMLTASSLLAKTGVPAPLRRFWQFTLGAAAGMPSAGAAASLLGFTAGYPLGVKTAVALYKDNKLDQKNAKLMCYACVHPGIAFSVFAAGLGMFRSSRLGWSFYLSVLLADIFLSRSMKYILKPEKYKYDSGEATHNTALSEALPAAVETAIRSILEICGWVLLFGAARRMAETILPKQAAWLTAITEVTNAAIFAAKNKAAVFCAFALGFGGISLMLQLLKDLQAVGICPAYYLLCRLFAGAFSAAFEWGFLKLLPPAAVATGGIKIRAVNPSAGLPGTAALLLLCIVFMAELAPAASQNKRFSTKKNRQKIMKNNA